MNRILRTLAVAGLLLCGAPAAAGSLGCSCIFPGSLPLTIATPNSCWILTSPISGASPITVTAGNVTIDLNGKSITSTSGTWAITATGTAGLRVSNGSIVGDGISVTGGIGVVLEDLQMANDPVASPFAQAIQLQNTTNFTIRDVQITGYNTGILAFAPAGNARVSGTIADNQLQYVADGIGIIRGTSVAILDNRVSQVACTASCAGYGVVVSDSIGARVGGNTIETTTLDGLAVLASSNSQIYENVVRGAGADGILVDAASEHTDLLRNTVSAAGQHGIRVDGTRNRIDGNLSNANGTSGTFVGLFLGASSTGNLYRENVARGNTGPFPGCAGGTSDLCDLSATNTAGAGNFMP